MDEHGKPLNWKGWEEGTFALEMQQPWSVLLLNREKTVETRAYPLPQALFNRKIYVLETQKGSTTSSLGNRLRVQENPNARLVGWVVFRSTKEYTSELDFRADEEAHRVQRSSPFGWKASTTTVVYGWVTDHVGRDLSDLTETRTAVRRMRSLFELVPEIKDP